MAKVKNQPAPETEAVQTEVPVNDPAAVNANPVEAGETKTTKSVVPAKYAGKYKNGGQGPLSEFIRANCGEGDKFEFPAFFSICRSNGIPEEKVAHYEALVATKANGVNGRARMTLANMLRAKARKDGKLVGLNGEAVDVPEPKVAVSGAAAKQVEASQGGTDAGSAPEAEVTDSETVAE